MRYLLISFILLIVGCGDHQEKSLTSKLTSEEKANLELFFNTLLLRNSGAYVLFGSKPMATCEWDQRTQEDVAEELKHYTKEQLKDAVFMYIPFNFQWWLQVEKRINVKNYLLLYTDSWHHPKIKFVYFVNIANLTNLLINNYELFKQYYGKDFFPAQMVFEIQKEHSEFWKMVFKNHILFGLVLGFGRENSFIFNEWMNRDEFDEKEKIYFQNLPFNFSDEESYKMQLDDYKKLNTNRFLLPIYRCLPNDATIKKYREEREKIKKIYKGKDFLEVTLEKLSR